MGIKLIPFHSEISEYSRLSGPVLDLSQRVGISPEPPVSTELKAEEASRGSHVIAFVLTGGTEHIIRAAKAASKSILLVYHDLYNSLPAVLEAASETGSMTLSVREVKEIEAYIKAALASDKIEGSKALLIGKPSPWLIHSGEPELLSKIGMWHQQVELDELIHDYQSSIITERDISEEIRRAELEGVSLGDINSAKKVEKAIRAMLSKNGASCFSIRCFDLIDRISTTACLALSRLNDEGFTAGCEGDVSAMATMHVLNEVSNKPSFMGNVVSVGEDGVMLAHCTSPTAILESFSFMTHFESGKGVGIKGRFPQGQEFTIARIDLKSGILRAGTGVSESVNWRNDVCRTQLKLKMPGASIIVKRPIGNHYVATIGNYVNELEMYAYIKGFKFENVNKYT